MNEEEWALRRAIKVSSKQDVLDGVKGALVELIDDRIALFRELEEKEDATPRERWQCSGARFALSQLREIIQRIDLVEVPEHGSEKDG